MRVLIPYIIWSILYSIYNDMGGKRFIINIFTTKASGHLYYIFVYIQFVLLTPFLVKLIKSRYNWTVWFIAPISTIIFKYYWLLSGNKENRYISLIWELCCLGWFTYYCLGLILGNKLRDCNYSVKKLTTYYIISIFVQMLEGYGWLLLGETNCGTQIKLTSFITSTIFLLIAHWFIINDNIKLKNRFLICVGDYSFGIYLSHMMVMQIVYQITKFINIPFFINAVIIMIISFLFVSIGRKICGSNVSKYIGFM